MKTAASDGPWMCDRGGMILDAHMAPVAQVLGKRGTNEFQANGNLLTTAPEMLELLKLLSSEADPTKIPPQEFGEAIDRARAIINKAEPQ